MKAYRTRRLFTVMIAILSCWGFFVVVSATPADLIPLACPSTQVTWLEGHAPAYESLLVYVTNRAVGGGMTDGAGVWRIPLRVRDTPGQYRVEVRSRMNTTLYATFTCFVDIPVDGVLLTPTASPLPQQASPPPPPTFTFIPRPTPPSIATSTFTAANTPTATSTASGKNPIDNTFTPTNSGMTTTATPTPTATGTIATPTPTATGTTATATPTPTATGTVATPTPTATQLGLDVVFGVILDDVNTTENDEDTYVDNQTGTSLDLTGWIIRRESTTAGRSAIFYTLRANTILPDSGSLDIFTTSGTDAPDQNIYYAGYTATQWANGDIAVLYTAANSLVKACKIEGQDCNDCTFNAANSTCAVINTSAGRVREGRYARFFDWYHWPRW